eukprot:scaffold14624_cov100-Cylindrotheca_fusiformis.AAC.3
MGSPKCVVMCVRRGLLWCDSGFGTKNQFHSQQVSRPALHSAAEWSASGIWHPGKSCIYLNNCLFFYAGAFDSRTSVNCAYKKKQKE